MGQSGIYRDLPNKFGKYEIQFSVGPFEHVHACLSAAVEMKLIGRFIFSQ